MSSKRLGLLPVSVLAALAVALVGAALAWACSPAPGGSYGVSPGSGPAQSTVTVAGTRFPQGPVRIHWESSTGPMLATVTGPNFSVPVTIPADSAGVHAIVAYGSTGGRASAPFRITATAPPPGVNPPPATAPPSGGGTGNGGGAGDGGANPGGTGESPAGTGQRPGAPTGEQGEVVTGGGGTGGGQRGDSRRQASGRADGQRGGTRETGGGGRTPALGGRERSAPGGAGGGAPALLRNRTGQTVFGGSVASPGSRDGSARGADSGGVSAVPGGASERSAVGDLWSGFSSDSKPSLTPGGADLAVPGGTGSPFTVGAIMLGLGLLAIMGGFLVAALRRRKEAEADDGR